MNPQTGVTIYEQVVSTDQNNVAVSATTFDAVLYRNGADSGIVPAISLYDPVRAIFEVTYVPDVYGQYQLYMKNSVTNVIFISDVYFVSSGGTTNIYVGL